MQYVRCQSFCILPLFIHDTLRQGTHQTVMALTSLESHHSEDLSKPSPLLESVAGRKYHCPFCLSSPSLQCRAKSKSWRLMRSLVWLAHPGSRRKVSDVLYILNFVLWQPKEKISILIPLRSQKNFKFTKNQRFAHLLSTDFVNNFNCTINPIPQTNI